MQTTASVPVVSSSWLTIAGSLLDRLLAFQKDFDAIVENMPAMINYGISGALRPFLNKFGREYLQKTSDDLVKFHWPDVIHPEDMSVVQEFHKARQQKKDFAGQYRVRKHDGTFEMFQEYAAYYRGDYISVLFNVEQVERQKTELRKREQMIRNLLDNIPIGTLLWTLDVETGDITFVTRRHERWIDLIHEDDRQFTQDILQKAMESPPEAYGNVPMEFGNRMLMGHRKEWRYFRHKLTPFRDNTCRIKKWIGVSFDIHEQALARQQAETMMHARSKMWSILSHEIRLPASCIIGNLELLMESNDLCEKKQELIMTSHRSAECLLRLLNDILSFSKLEADRVVLEHVEFRPRDLMDDLLSLLHPLMANNKHVCLGGWCDDDVPCVLVGDPYRLTQIMLNLGGNAIKFTSIGHVLIRVMMMDKTDSHVVVRFSVKDTGIGLSEVEKRVLFEPFVQCDSSTSRKYGGTGLGLSISNRLVELMNSTLTCVSAKGQGSEFYFDVSLGFRKEQHHTPPHQQAFCYSDCSIFRGYLGSSLDLINDVSVDTRVIVVDMLCHRKTVVADSFQQHWVAWANATWQRLQELGINPRVIAVCPSHDDDPTWKLMRDHPLFQGSVSLTEPLTRKKLIKALTDSPLINTADAENVRKRCHDDVINNDESLILVAEDNHVAQKLLLAQLKKLGYRAEAFDNGLLAVEAWKTKRYTMAIFDQNMPVMDGVQAANCIRDLEESTMHAHGHARTSDCGGGGVNGADGGVNGGGGSHRKFICLYTADTTMTMTPLPKAVDKVILKPIHLNKLKELLQSVK